ncbi:MAG: methyltransferase [Candidatus Accumulibacter sp.]|uniref:methyltransferase family protein n=1 Tax=Accumulibacter sp. TaxID=2053492 RepID=UPI0028788D19|nr:methyltransferase [Accumulibacter sp.]MDS4015307.1 methyltransferase [Accumulibacter sp.]HRD74382.1 methyltransferase [Hyphomicrobiaceae bacterium]
MSPIETVCSAIVLVYMALFLILTARAARASGQSFWLFGKGSESQALPALLFRLSFVGVAFYALTALVLGDPLAAPVHNALDGRFGDLVGAALASAGAGLALYSQIHMGRSWRIGAASGQLGTIVRTGPFAFSRNPVFVGQVMLFLGLALALPNLIQFTLSFLLLAAVHRQVRIEERVLEGDLGAEYQTYRREVRRWI